MLIDPCTHKPCEQGVVDAIAAEETRVLAMQREHQRLRQRLLTGEREGQGKERGQATDPGALPVPEPSAVAEQAAGATAAAIGGGRE